MVSTQTTAKTRAPLNFSGQNLRGRNFVGQDLAGADFSGADIRGARFTNTNLTGAKFVSSNAGAPYSWKLTQFITVLASILIINLVAANFTGFYAAILFDPRTLQGITIIPGIFVVAFQILSFSVVACQGFNFRILAMLLLTAIAVAVAGLGATSVAGAVTVAVAGSITVAIVESVAILTVGLLPSILAMILIGTTSVFMVAKAEAISVEGAVLMAVVVAGLITIFSSGLGVFTAWRASQGDEKYILVQNLSLALITLGCTSFAGSNLTNVDFSKARLKGTNFNHSRKQGTILKHVWWNNAKKLDKARIDQSILADNRVKQLLTERTGHNKNYARANLHEANLNGIFLEQANLHRTDITDATCRDADLSHTTLTELQAIGTDFTGSTLTGACIENWSIDDTTVLDNITCDYIYLRNDPKLGFCERRPHNPDKTFQPGDFKKYVQDIQDTLQLLIRNGTTPDALRAALKELERKHGITADHIIETKRTGDNREDLLIAFDPPHRVDKAGVEDTFDTAIAQQLQAAQAEVARLEDRCEYLEQAKQELKQDKRDLMQVLLKAQERPTNITMQQNQGDNASQSADSFTQNNSGGTNFQTQANDSTLNQGENINQNNGADTK